MANIARNETDKLLYDLERRMQAVYLSDPALLRIQKEYEQYMKEVEDSTKDAYSAFREENDIEHREELKRVYKGQAEALTIKNERYNDIVSSLTKALADANQKALDIANNEMPKIYALNYNQISTDCRKAGIKINGTRKT